MTLLDHQTAESIVNVRNLLDDNLRLLRVVKIRIGRHEELVALIEETVTTIEGMAGKWKRVGR